MVGSSEGRLGGPSGTRSGSAPCWCAAALANARFGACCVGASNTVTARFATCTAESPTGEMRNPKITTKCRPSDRTNAGGKPVGAAIRALSAQRRSG